MAACAGGGSKQDKENYPLLKELNQLRDSVELSASNWHQQRDSSIFPSPRRSWLLPSDDTRQDSKFGVTSKLTSVAHDSLGWRLFYMHARAWVAITTTQDFFKHVGLSCPGCKAPMFCCNPGGQQLPGSLPTSPLKNTLKHARRNVCINYVQRVCNA